MVAGFRAFSVNAMRDLLLRKAPIREYQPYS